MEFFESMEPLLRLFWYVALASSLIFIIQSILTFIGMDGHDSSATDVHTHVGGDDTSFHIFTLRNLINFSLGFSWAGISFYNIINNHFLLICIAIIIGIQFIALFFYLMIQINRLSQDNSFKINNTIDKIGSVYLSIPERKTGKGKVQVSVNGAFHELDAITENEKIETGATIKVIKIEDNDLVVVEKM